MQTKSRIFAIFHLYTCILKFADVESALEIGGVRSWLSSVEESKTEDDEAPEQARADSERTESRLRSSSVEGMLDTHQNMNVSSGSLYDVGSAKFEHLFIKYHFLRQ